MNTRLSAILYLGLSLGVATAAQAQHELIFNPTQNDKVSVPMTLPATGALTVEAWVYYAGATYLGTYNTVLEFGNDDPWFGVNNAGQVEYYPDTQGGAMPVQTWVHIAYTWDGLTGRVYMNGSMVGSSSEAPDRTGGSLGIGFNSGDTGWNGSIDEVMVWNTARTASQLQADAAMRQDLTNALPPSPAGLRAYFKFNEGSGQTVANLAPGGAAGTLGSTNAVEGSDPAWTVPVQPNGVWHGIVSNEYHNPANWSNNVVPGASDDVVISGTAVHDAVLSTSVAARSVTTQAGATMIIQPGGTLTLSGALINQGTLQARQGRVVTNGAATQLFGGNAIAFGELTVGPAGVEGSQPGLSFYIHRRLTLDGDLQLNGIHCELMSDDQGTATVVNNGTARVLGDVTVQRYIDPTLNVGRGYRHLSSPVMGATVAAFAAGAGNQPVVNAAYNNSPTPGSVTPFPTVFGYEQNRLATAVNNLGAFDKGWFSPAGLSTPLLPTSGFTVNMPAMHVYFTGTLNTGNISRSNLGRGTNSNAGWHLLGNPYPSPINWNLLTRTGIDNAVYVYKSTGQYAGSYTSYVNGIGTNGGSNILPLGQAFFVRTSAVGVSGTLDFTNAARLTTYSTDPVQRGTADTRPLLQLELQGGSAADQVAVYFESGATPGFDVSFDAYKVQSNGPLHLALEAGAEDFAINGLPLIGSADVSLPLAISVAQPGRYTLRAAQLLNLPARTQAYLRDALTGALVNLQQQASYSFTANSTDAAGRFTLVFTANGPLAAAPAQLAQQVSLFPNPAKGQLYVGLPASARQQATEVVLLNGLGQEVRRSKLAAGSNAPLSLEGMAPGVYLARVQLAEGVVTKRLVIE